MVACAPPWDIESHASEFFKTPKELEFVQAAAKGDTHAMERLITIGVNVNARGDKGVTPLWWAIRTESKAGFRWLLANGANPNADFDHKVSTIMQLAAASKDSAFLKIILPYKPSLEGRIGARWETPLKTAISRGTIENLELLIKAGANIDGTPGDFPPMSHAVALAKYEAVLVLLLAGADFSRTLDVGVNAGGNHLVLAIQGRYIDPNDDAYIWHERVIAFLKSKGITATRPPGEGVRTKSLPPDLR